jgi:hypothetical protein
MSKMQKPKILPTKEIKKDCKPCMHNDDRPSIEKQLADPRVMDVAFRSLVLSGCIR